MAEAETYWKSLWGEEAQHNERAEWLRREQKRKISHMDWRHIQITKISFYLLKLTIGNLLKMIKYKITDLKLSQLPTGLFAKKKKKKKKKKKNFNAIIEELEKTPNWMTTGITYLITKSGDSKEVRNYLPIICLQE